MTGDVARAEEDGGLRRVTTGVPGLDAVLHGGLFTGGAYILQGAPGAGKTTLANQICFHHARTGGRALFVTLLAESHARMRQNMEAFSFFEAGLVPDGVYYISAFSALADEGLNGLMVLLRREIHARRTTMLVLDGLMIAAESAGSDQEFRRFIHEMQAHLAAQGCVALLLTGGSRSDDPPEHTMVDGLITLEDVHLGNRVQRSLEVRKTRASNAIRGRHPYRITRDGIVLYPRTEAMLAYPSRVDANSSERVVFGVPDLDAIMEGGPLRGTTTLVLGASGTGKTTLGMHFLARSSAEDPGLHFGFYETPERLKTNAAAVGLDLARLVQQGHLEILWQPPTEQILDDLASQLMTAVRRRKVRRLFVDGIGGYVEAADQMGRISQVFTALANELRAQGVTTVYAGETNNLVGPEVTVPVEGISAIVENLVLLRFAEYRARLYRLLSIMKVRGSGFDPRLREFRITDAGIRLADSFESAESILSGFGTDRSEDSSEGQRRDSDKPGTRPARTPRRRSS